MQIQASYIYRSVLTIVGSFLEDWMKTFSSCSKYFSYQRQLRCRPRDLVGVKSSVSRSLSFRFHRSSNATPIVSYHETSRIPAWHRLSRKKKNRTRGGRERKRERDTEKSRALALSDLTFHDRLMWDRVAIKHGEEVTAPFITRVMDH